MSIKSQFTVDISSSVSKRIKSEAETFTGLLQNNDLLLSLQLCHEPTSNCCCAGLCFNPVQWSDHPERQWLRRHTTMGCLWAVQCLSVGVVWLDSSHWLPLTDLPHRRRLSSYWLTTASQVLPGIPTWDSHDSEMQQLTGSGGGAE